jgi:uncharacterized protein (UPF0210 family)
MIPVAGDVSQNTISSIILDVYTASFLMKKPLGVRILPIPNSRIGDRTKFKHLFFTNTIIRDISSGITTQNLPNQDIIYKIRDSKSE